MGKKEKGVETKTIDEMTLEELSTLKQIVSSESERYADMLTTYATMYGDTYLQNIGPKEEKMYKKRTRYVRLIELIELRIDAKIDEICEKNHVKVD